MRASTAARTSTWGLSCPTLTLAPPLVVGLISGMCVCEGVREYENEGEGEGVPLVVDLISGMYVCV